MRCAGVERRNDCRLQRGEGAIGGGGAAVKREPMQQRRRIKLEIGDALIDVRTTFATQGSLCSEPPTRGRKCTSACREDAPDQLPSPLDLSMPVLSFTAC
jgi:hypothetical protein